MKITITKTTSPKIKPDYSNLGFGRYFTDHMFLMNYTEGKGWH
ncbi:MAG TPA: branched chain amino acid aminotransferase, partial [Clostridiales bacterium]|nr:branched chain amino acid aminotransferase [Clostridiales bacterium]